MEHHKIGDEEDIKLKYRINEIQTKPEARLWLAHLLHLLNGEINPVEVKIEIKANDNNKKIRELRREQKQPFQGEFANEELEKREKIQQYFEEHHLEVISLTDKGELLIKYQNNREVKVIAFDNSEETIKEYFQFIKKEDKKNLHGIMIAKKDKNGELKKKFFRLEKEYKNERELHRDTYPIM